METRASFVIVGAFVFAMFAAAMGFVIWLGKLDLDKAVTPYAIRFTGSVTGLSIGSPVRYRGIPVGSVTDIDIDPENVERILVSIEVDEKIPIKSDAHAVLESQGLTGVGFIQIKGGSQSAPVLAPGPGRDVAEIPARASALEEVFESAPEIANQLVVLINRASMFLKPENQRNFEQSLANFATISGALAAQADDIQSLITNLGDTTATLKSTTERLSPLIEQLTMDVSDLSEDTSQTLAALRGTAVGVDAEVTELADKLTSTIGRIEEAAMQTRSMIKENRGGIRDFTSRGLYELSEFLIEGRVLLESLNRAVRQIERDPSRFLFGDRGGGVKAQ